jgi:hypothetical protein
MNSKFVIKKVPVGLTYVLHDGSTQLPNHTALES